MMMPAHRVHAPVQQLPKVERNDTDVLQVITEVPFDADPVGGTKKKKKRRRKKIKRETANLRFNKEFKRIHHLRLNGSCQGIIIICDWSAYTSHPHVAKKDGGSDFQAQLELSTEL